jgi:hypothetical protein
MAGIAKLTGENQYLKIRHRAAMAREIFKTAKRGDLGKQLFFGVGAIPYRALIERSSRRKILRFISFQQAQFYNRGRG